MFVLDNFLGFVFRSIATAVDQELNDDTRLKQRLIEAQLALEEGRIDEAEFSAVERDVFDRMHALRAGEESVHVIGGDARVVAAEIDVHAGDD